MGRHTKRERPDDEPAPDDPAPAGSFLGAPPGPSFEAFSGPTDDQVFFSYEPYPPASSPGSPAGPPPAAQRQHGPPDPRRFEPYPGDYPGDLPAAMAGRDDRVPGAPAPGYAYPPQTAATVPAAPGYGYPQPAPAVAPPQTGYGYPPHPAYGYPQQVQPQPVAAAQLITLPPQGPQFQAGR